MHPNAPVEIQISEDNRQAQFDFQKCVAPYPWPTGTFLPLCPVFHSKTLEATYLSNVRVS